MREIKRTRSCKKGVCGAMRWLAMALLSASLLVTGCSRMVYVPVEASTAHNDTARIVMMRIDSVVIRDSVALVQRGDTVFHTVWRERVQERVKIDTLYRAVGDTLRMEVPVPVERDLTAWEKIKMDFGGIAIGCAVAGLMAIIIWLVQLIRRKV